MSLSRLFFAAAAPALLVIGAGQLSGQGGSTPLTLVSKDARRTIAVTLINNREFVALDDLASVFQLAVREEAGAITVSYKGATIVLTPDQALASAAGRLISLPTPPIRVASRWLVPLEFISRALAPAYDVRLDLRAPSHLLVMGDVRVPRVTLRYESLPTSARLTIDQSPPTTSTVTQEPGRLSIKFDADALDIALPNVSGQGLVPLVQALRIADAVTLAIDLGPRFSSFRASTQQVDVRTTRLVLDILAIQAETAVPAPVTPTPPPAELPVFGPPTSTIRTVVLDPGHGGDDEGVKGADGAIEKELTLIVARRAKAALESRLGIRVLLTRDDDRRVALDERAALANNNKADLFLSLHANGSLRSATTGASIYFAAFTDDDRAQAALAPVRVPIFGGGSRNIELVPWDLAQIRHVDQSSELARMIQRELENRVPLDPRPLDRAPFRVLESANMPAVLVEMGYLTNPAQEHQLGTAEFQNAFVLALSDAVARFRDFLSGNGGDR